MCRMFRVLTVSATTHGCVAQRQEMCGLSLGDSLLACKALNLTLLPCYLGLHV